MLKRSHHPENSEKTSKQRDFRDKFPDKQTVEARIAAEIDAMSLAAPDKNRLKRIFNGGGGQPGLVDALFALDR